MNTPLAISAIALVAFVCGTSSASQLPCVPDAPCIVDEYEVNQPPSWIFSRSTFTHDPYSGARVAQYMRTPPVEPLDDERNYTSRYRRSRTNLRGHDGSVDTYYEVQAWGNGRGGIDAEWERFHEAWKESILSGGFYNSPGGPWSGGFSGGYGAGSGFPGHGFPGYGFPGNGFPGHGYGGGWQGGSPHSGWNGGHHGHHHGGGNHGGSGHDDHDE